MEYVRNIFAKYFFFHQIAAMMTAKGKQDSHITMLQMKLLLKPSFKNKMLYKTLLYKLVVLNIFDINLPQFQ